MVIKVEASDFSPRIQRYNRTDQPGPSTSQSRSTSLANYIPAMDQPLPPSSSNGPPPRALPQQAIRSVSDLSVSESGEISETSLYVDLDQTALIIGPTAADNALKLQDQIERREAEFEQQKLQLYQEALSQLESAKTQDQIDRIQQQLRESASLLVDQYDMDMRKLFHKQELELAQLTQAHNDLRAQGVSEESLEAKLHQLELRVELRDSSNSSRNVTHTRVRLFAATVTKRFALRRELIELQGKSKLNLKARNRRKQLERELYPERSSSTYRQRLGRYNNIRNHLDRGQNRSELHEISRSLERHLGSTPSVSYLNLVAKQITQAYQQDPLLLTPEESKQQYGQNTAQLEWGTDHMNQALKSPENWPETSRFALMRSASGNYYAFATLTRPRGNRIQGLVPSGRRKQDSLMPTNFHKNQFYMIGHRSQTEAISYRGGQFPTPEAALSALQVMMVETGKKEFHINALFTPTSLPGNHDRDMLEQHHHSIQAALAHIDFVMNTDVQELEEADQDLARKLHNAGYNGKETTRLRKQALILTNFGVNEGATNTLGVKGNTVSLGWHTALRKYDNQAMQAFDKTLKERLNGTESRLAQRIPLQSTDRELLRNLDAISTLGLSIQEMWRTNSFADATADNDQLKMPASLKALDLMIGIVPYTDCMSGKDRTGEAEAAAHLRVAEIQMQQHERRQYLEQLIDRMFDGVVMSLRQKEALLSSSFSDPDLRDIRDKCDRDMSLDQVIAEQQEERILRASETLSYIGSYSSAWLEKKEVGTGKFSTGTKHVSRRNSRELTPSDPAERQRLALNRRQMGFGSGANTVTLMNAGFMGSKLNPTIEMARYSAGFDIEAITEQYIALGGQIDTKKIARQIGLDSLPPDSKAEMQAKLSYIAKNPSRSDFSLWLEEVAVLKRKSFNPLTKVKV